jgi:hypothetical protein
MRGVRLAWIGMAAQYVARPVRAGMARQRSSRCGRARQARLGSARHGSATLARQIVVTLGKARPGPATPDWHGLDRRRLAGMARVARSGEARQAWRRIALPGQSRYGRHVWARIRKDGAARIGWPYTAGPERSAQHGTAGICFALQCRHDTAGRRSARHGWTGMVRMVTPRRRRRQRMTGKATL